jgi:hypothetical protein
MPGSNRGISARTILSQQVAFLFEQLRSEGFALTDWGFGWVFLRHGHFLLRPLNLTGAG